MAAMPQITFNTPTSISMIPANRIQPRPGSSYAPWGLLHSSLVARTWSSSDFFHRQFGSNGRRCWAPDWDDNQRGSTPGSRATLRGGRHRLGDDDADLIGEPLDTRVVRISLRSASACSDTNRVRDWCSGGVAEGPESLAVNELHRHLDRVLDAVRAAGRLHEPHRPFHRCPAGSSSSRRSARDRTGPPSPSTPTTPSSSEAPPPSSNSRRIAWKPAITPLWTNSQRPWRNGWQLVCCTGVPVVARMCARNSGDSTLAATSRRLTSLQAGVMLRYRPVRPPPPYAKPSPKPSPLVHSMPIRACRL